MREGLGLCRHDPGWVRVISGLLWAVFPFRPLMLKEGVERTARDAERTVVQGREGEEGQGVARTSL